VTRAPFRRAVADDAPALAALVNAAFSGKGGWTNESHLFRGYRTDPEEVRRIITAADTLFIVFPREDAITGCAYVKRMSPDSAFLGLFAVSPSLQGGGIGKRILAECERIARDEWGCTTMVLSTTTTHRPELASFYVRRGYARTGDFRPLKRHEAKEKAKVEGLLAEWLAKTL
jgi:GNAT superfamily N-acetyltransferase